MATEGPFEQKTPPPFPSNRPGRGRRLRLAMAGAEGVSGGLRRHSGLAVDRLSDGNPLRPGGIAKSNALSRLAFVHRSAGEPQPRTARSPCMKHMCAHPRTPASVDFAISRACETTRLCARRLTAALSPCRCRTRAFRAAALRASQLQVKRAIRTRHASRTSAYPRAHRVDARLPDRSSFCPDVKMIAR